MPKPILAALALLVLALTPLCANAQETPSLPHQQWSFDGIFGTYDRAAQQRGFQVYKEVCSACHPVKHLYFRDLTDIGYTEDEVKAIASTYQVTNEQPNDEGQMYQRPGRPSDPIPGPFPNDQAARAANNGALPPDLSMIVKAREGGPELRFRHPDRVQGAAARVQPIVGDVLQRIFPRSSDRDAAAAQRQRRDFCRRHFRHGAADGA